MPDMNGVPPLKIGSPPRDKTIGCGGEYFSDTHIEGKHSMHAPKRIEQEIEVFKREHGASHREGKRQGRFVAFDRHTTWTEAQSMCLRLREEADLEGLGLQASDIKSPNLATIANEDENTAVKELTEKTCGHVTSMMNGWDLCAWTGLNDAKEEGEFEWVDGSVSSYRNFYDGEPNNMNDEDYVGACWSLQGKWIDLGVAFELPCVLCELHPPEK
mmetsp:Transcript_30230/g.78140  ORF Transcript_30230/g.78140 Transcript_30230/m.78140 type:complete len:215 (-) Transcript_30230:396-1040(-)